LGAFFLI